MLTMKLFQRMIMEDFREKSLQNVNKTNDDDDDDDDDYDYEYDEAQLVISISVRYPLLLSLVVPSLLAYLFIIICILTSKTFRSAPHNYVFILILLVSLMTVSIDIPFSIDHYRPTPMIQLSKSVCLFWWFISLFSIYTSQFLIAWASFERHLLIFHNHFFNKKWRNLCFHYLPPLLLIIYMLIFYIYMIFVYPCEDVVDLAENSCPNPCYSWNSVLSIWEAVFHGLFPTFSTFLCNIALLLRIYRSKSRLRQSMNWRKYRTMIFQLISIALLFLSVNFPSSLCVILYFAGIYSWTSAAMNCLDFLFYLIPLLSPLIFLFTIPEIRTNLRKILRRQANGQVTTVPRNAFTRSIHPMPISAPSRRI